MKIILQLRKKVLYKKDYKCVFFLKKKAQIIFFGLYIYFFFAKKKGGRVAEQGKDIKWYILMRAKP